MLTRDSTTQKLFTFISTSDIFLDFDFTGYFESHDYDKSGKKTFYHYVTITKNYDGTYYTWKTAGGVKWTLYPDDPFILRVGSDCPFYSDGHRYATFTEEGVFGPGKELYRKEGIHIVPLTLHVFKRKWVSVYFKRQQDLLEKSNIRDTVGSK